MVFSRLERYLFLIVVFAKTANIIFLFVKQMLFGFLFFSFAMRSPNIALCNHSKTVSKHRLKDYVRTLAIIPIYRAKLYLLNRIQFSRD